MTPGTVSVVSTASLTVTATIGTPNGSDQYPNPEAIVVSPDGTTGYVSHGGLGIVSVLNLATDSVTRTITVSSPTALALSPDGRELYATAGVGAVENVSVIATATDTITGTIPSVGFAYTTLAVSPSGSLLYITEDGDIVVYDTTTKAVVHTITGAGRASVLSPDGATLYAADASTLDTVDVINTATNAIIRSITIGTPEIGSSAGTAALAIGPDGHFLYAAGLFDYQGTLTVINTARAAVSGAVPTVGAEPIAVAFSPDGTKAYVASSGFNVGATFGAGITVIDTATGIATAAIASAPGGLIGPDGVALSPDGKTLYVANSGSQFSGNTLSVIDTSTDTITATVTVGRGPQGIAVSPDGTTAYVANATDGTVSVVDTATRTAINAINVGRSAGSVVVSPDGKTLYTTCLGVSAIDTASGQVTATITDPSLGDALLGIAVRPDGVGRLRRGQGQRLRARAHADHRRGEGHLEGGHDVHRRQEGHVHGHDLRQPGRRHDHRVRRPAEGRDVHEQQERHRHHLRHPGGERQQGLPGHHQGQ
jgi:YVTN family beta-propeller protein